jgi:hypothetical protein
VSQARKPALPSTNGCGSPGRRAASASTFAKVASMNGWFVSGTSMRESSRANRSTEPMYCTMPSGGRKLTADAPQ